MNCNISGLFAIVAWSVLAQIAAAAAAPPALASGPDVAAEGETRTEACGGQDAKIAGNRNTVSFTGICRSLTIRGDGNRVTLGVAAGAPVDVQGGGNQIRLTAGRPGRLQISGSDTMLSLAGGAAPAADAASISGDGQNLELQCGAQPVTLESNRSRFVLRGGCREIAVRGAHNRVDAELAPGARLRIEGDGTIVTYRLKGAGAAPVATVLGVGSLLEADSAVAQGAAPAAPPPGVTRVVALMQDLQGAVVMEGTQVRLGAELFAGAAVMPGAEARMGELAELIGRINPKGVRIVGNEPSDQALATQRAAAVQAWLAGPGRVALPVQSGGARGEASAVVVTILR